jgi:hypothetical protein
MAKFAFPVTGAAHLVTCPMHRRRGEQPLTEADWSAWEKTLHFTIAI